MHAVVERDGIRDEVAVEEPLEIRIDGTPLAVTMGTPGQDEELAAGFLFGEGLLDGPPSFLPDPDLAANRSMSRARCFATPAHAASTPRRRAACAERARSRRWPS